jgi:hypothetical protein
MAYLSSADLLPTLQSGFPTRSFDKNRRPPGLVSSLELLQALDRGDFVALVPLDLTAAFNTINRDILLRRPQQTESRPIPIKIAMTITTACNSVQP